jgi:hypothetical protein
MPPAGTSNLHLDIRPLTVNRVLRQAPAAMPQGFTNDLTEPVSRNATPPVQKGSRSNAKRRQTLLSLLDALNELTGVNDLDGTSSSVPPTWTFRAQRNLSDAAQMPSFESDRDVREFLH